MKTSVIYKQVSSYLNGESLTVTVNSVSRALITEEDKAKLLLPLWN